MATTGGGPLTANTRSLTPEQIESGIEALAMLRRFQQQYVEVVMEMAPIDYTPLHTLTDGLYAAAGDLLRKAGDGPWQSR